MKKDDIKYCIVTEGADFNFPYLRVMINSLLKHNYWVKDNIIIMTCDLTPLSSHNREILKSISDRIQFVDIDTKWFSDITVKNQDRNRVLLSLYRLNCFNLKTFDVALYISSYSVCVRSITHLFEGHSDINLANSGRLARSTKNPNELVRNSELNSSVMLISDKAMVPNIFNTGIDSLNRTKRITDISVHNIIHETLKKELLNYRLYDLNVISNKSKFPDSKFRDYKAVQQKVCILNMDIELTKTANANFMFKRINSIWNSYNQLEKINIENTSSISKDELFNIKKQVDPLSSYPKNVNAIETQSRIQRNTMNKKSSRKKLATDIEKFTIKGTSFLIKDDIKVLKKFIGTLDEIKKKYETYEIIFGFSNNVNKNELVELQEQIDHLYCYELTGLDPISTLTSLSLYDTNFIIDNSVEFHPIKKASNSEFKNAIPISKVNIGIMTGAWKRKQLTKYYNMHNKFLMDSFENHANVVSVLVDSGGYNRESSVEYGSQYYDFPNKPLSNKFNYAMSKFKHLGMDAVMIMGTDNFIDYNMFAEYIKTVRNGYDLIGALDSYIYDSLTGSMFHFIGYTNYRFGETLGAGRVLSKKVLQMLDYRPWKNGLSRGLDRSMWDKIKLLNIIEYKIQTKKNNFLLLGVKTDVFMSNIKLFKNINAIDKEILKKIPCLREYY